MLITGIGLYDLQEKESKRPVESALGATGTSTYFQDRNPDRTHVMDFNRELQKKQQDLEQQEKKLRDLRKSEDLKLLYAQQRNSVGTKINVIR